VLKNMGKINFLKLCNGVNVLKKYRKDYFRGILLKMRVLPLDPVLQDILVPTLGLH